MVNDTETVAGRKAALSPEGAEAVATYGRYLREHEDLAAPTLRNYFSDLRRFAAWYEGSYMEGWAEGATFDPAGVTTPAITAYRSWMQHEARLKPATINRVWAQRCSCACETAMRLHSNLDLSSLVASSLRVAVPRFSATVL